MTEFSMPGAWLTVFRWPTRWPDVPRRNPQIEGGAWPVLPFDSLSFYGGINEGASAQGDAADQEVTVKYRLRAALAAIVIGLIPVTVSASGASSWILATQYVVHTHTLTGLDKSWQSAKLRHGAVTVHQFVADPSAFPPDPCRALAIAWNVAVFQNRQQSVFDGLLMLSAQAHCAVNVTRANAANADGSYDMLTVAPTP
ncbi:MAG: hypothetical protein U0359_18800 [Byssovorax sp.]